MDCAGHFDFQPQPAKAPTHSDSIVAGSGIVSESPQAEVDMKEVELTLASRRAPGGNGTASSRHFESIPPFTKRVSNA